MLPIRLGMLNSSGTQDLIVHVLARDTRYEAASYDNAFIPTNLEVDDAVREDFGGFYAALFDKVLEEHPNAVVTEYAWQATNCDPCPGPVLSEQDLLSLGADVAVGLEDAEDGEDEPSATTTQWTTRVRYRPAEVSEGLPSEVVRRIARRHVNEIRFCHQSRLAGRPANEAGVDVEIRFTIDPAGAPQDIRVTAGDHAGLAECITASVRRWAFPEPRDGSTVQVRLSYRIDASLSTGRRPGLGFGSGGRANPLMSFVLTRLHYRYGRGALGDDLVLRPATPVTGGRGIGPANELPTGAETAPASNFQGRYIIRHPWTGPVECEDPQRGRWGGPPPEVAERSRPVAATNLGTQERTGASLEQLLKNPLPELGLAEVGGRVTAQAVEQETTPSEAEAEEQEGGDDGCGGCSASSAPTGWSLALIFLVGWMVSLRRER